MSLGSWSPRLPSSGKMGIITMHISHICRCCPPIGIWCTIFLELYTMTRNGNQIRHDHFWKAQEGPQRGPWVLNGQIGSCCINPPYVLRSDHEICRTCPAHFWWCPAESSDLTGHFVQQDSIHILCPTRKTRMTTDICQSSTGKMSDMGLKCPAERWRSAGHFVRHARNNFCDHWRMYFCMSVFAR